MSSDTGKENASVVDSSLTEKHEMGLADDLENSSYKVNEDAYPSLAEEREAGPFGSQLENSTEKKKGKLYDTRYFIIKSLNHHNLQLSIEKGIWATQVMNEPILEEAFHELPQDIGESLCDLLDGKGDVDGMLSSFFRDDLPSKRPCTELPYSLGDEEYHMPQLHMSLTRTPIPYPPYLYQHQAEARKTHLAQRSNGDTEKFLTSSPPSKLARMKHSRINGKLTHLQVENDTSSRYDFWGLSAESPLGSTITEDDFLEMSYEEYVEAHSRSMKQLYNTVGGPSWSMQESSSKKQDDDSNLSFVADTSRSRKRMHHSSQK